MRRNACAAALSLLLLLAGPSVLAGCTSQMMAAESGDSAADDLQGAASTVLGKVKAVNGNEILLAIAEESQGRNQPPGESAPGGAATNENPPEESAPGGDAPSRGARDGSRPDSVSGEGAAPEGEIPAGDFPSGDIPVGEAPADIPAGETSGAAQRGQNRQPGSQPGSFSVTLTGAEQTYLIPVTAAVTTGQGDSARTIRFTQLAVKNVIRLYLDENGAIFAVQVLS